MTPAARLREAWQSRAPRERTVLAALAAILGVLLYAWLVTSMTRADLKLRASLESLRSQARQVEAQAIELAGLRAAPAAARSATDLRALVQAQAAAAGIARQLARIDSLDADHVVTVFEAVAFADWLAWIDGLKSQQIRLELCRLESLSKPGLVSVTATLARAGRP